MSTVIDLSGYGGKENIGQRVVAGLLDESRGCNGDAYCDLVSRNEAEIAKTIEGYVNEVGDSVAQVVVSVNDYRESLGVGLVSVNIEAQDEGRCTLLLDGDVKSPTLGLVEPLVENGARFGKVGFKVSQGQAEQVSAVSEKLVFRRAVNVGGIVRNTCVCRGDDPITVLGGEYVAARLPILDEDRLDSAGLPFAYDTFSVSMLPPVGDQVYFCRYLTAKAAIGCCDQ